MRGAKAPPHRPYVLFMQWMVFCTQLQFPHLCAYKEVVVNWSMSFLLFFSSEGTVAALSDCSITFMKISNVKWVQLGGVFFFLWYVNLDSERHSRLFFYGTP